MVEVVQIIWALSLVVLLAIAACVQLYDQKHRRASPKKPTSLTDARSAKEAALREAASQSFRLNLMAMDAACKMSETASRHAKSDGWSQF